MKNFVLKGNIFHSSNSGELLCFPDSFVVCENGLCAGIYDRIPETYAGFPVTDLGDQIIIPGLSDLHVHAPQFSFRGLGMDMELLDWLNTYTFPEESKYADLAYADRAYGQFASYLSKSMTTRAVIFGTIHAPATTLLMEKLEASGMVSYVGKVNMDRNSPDYLREVSAQASLDATEEWICNTRSRFANTYPIITPRFVPSCTDELLAGLGKLAEQYKVPVQSHLSENLGEIAWVKELQPEAKFYGDAYDRFGLFGGNVPCIMAHCVHSGEEELQLMKERGVYIAHSPLSNTNLASGVAPVTKYMEEGLCMGLASDVAGGDDLNLFGVMAGAMRASKLRWRLQDQNVKQLSVDQAFYLATRGGGGFFGKVGAFDKGYEFDCVVLDDSSILHPQELSLRSRLERCFYLADERHVSAKYVRGAKTL
ncbi:MAG: amidohydrolase family protein [Oscillospiraceae bacterium]|nr:amidohydrolase family protein [Oscillospiraceae bacterium]